MATITKQSFLQRMGDKVSRAVYKGKAMTGNLEDNVLPVEGDATVGTAVGFLFDESQSYFASEFLRWKDSRFPYTSIDEWYKSLAQMENGDHWTVFGHRNTDSNDLWKSELVDDETGKQIRIRSTNINAGWHDVIINPNIKNISEIFDQERITSDWSKRIRMWQKTASIYGTAWMKSVLDKTKNPDGIVNEQWCRVGTVYKTPHSLGIEKSDGNWYIIEISMITDKMVLETYPDFDLSDVALASYDKLNRYFKDKVSEIKPLVYTGMYDKIELHCDDGEQIMAPYAEGETIIEHSTSAAGGEIDAHPFDNHKKHIDAHKGYLEQLNTSVPAAEMTEDDQNLLKAQNDLLNHHIGDHEKLMEKAKKRGLSAGHIFKYPYGRKIVTIGGKVADDIPNPYGMKGLGWRELWHPLKNEDVPMRDGGRGDVEILFNTNKAMDVAVSKIGDASSTYALPKAWFHENDRKLILDEYNNDPNTPGFYRTQPPSWRQANSPKEFFEILNYFKSNAQDRLGVTKTIQGKSPTQSASNKLAETLLRQSEALVMGELDQNMNDAIRKVIKTRLMLMKKFYTEPRYWFIHRTPKAINCSRILSTMEVKDEETGQINEVEIPDFEITVRPGSNLPNKWENQVEILTNAYKEIEDPAFQQGTIKLLEDIFAERFPQLGPNGEYYKIGEKMARALQLIAQQDAQAEAEQKDRDKLQSKVKSKATAALLKGEPMPQGSNGNQ